MMTIERYFPAEFVRAVRADTQRERDATAGNKSSANECVVISFAAFHARRQRHDVLTPDGAE